MGTGKLSMRRGCSIVFRMSCMLAAQLVSTQRHTTFSPPQSHTHTHAHVQDTLKNAIHTPVMGVGKLSMRRGWMVFRRSCMLAAQLVSTGMMRIT